MNLQAEKTNIPGVYVAQLTGFTDDRGSFFKSYNFGAFAKYMLNFKPEEVYITTSKRNVLRGMHFQVPPDDHAKVVVCLSGEVTDVVVDLRNTNNFGQVFSTKLDANGTNCVLMPKGVAHGFYTHKENSQLLYLVETVHSPLRDTGIYWNSIEYEWPCKDPIISDRDKNFEKIHDLKDKINW